MVILLMLGAVLGGLAGILAAAALGAGLLLFSVLMWGGASLGLVIAAVIGCNSDRDLS